MTDICPTVTAYDIVEFNAQLNRVAEVAPRIHIDLMDGDFAPTKSPELSQIKLPGHKTFDIHLMYRRPMDYLDQLIKLRPHLVIIHNEADVHHMHFAAELHRHGIKAGLALLQDTPVHYAHQIMHSFDHILVFSGNLGYHGGTADLNLLEKVRQIRQEHPDAEIGWDGGVNLNNAKDLAEGGVDALNVGGSIANAPIPGAAYQSLVKIISGHNLSKTHHKQR